jgi:hypothetical protein
MIDREFDVRAYEEGYRAGKHDAQVEIERLRAALKEITEDNWFFIEDAKGIARAALGGDK